MCMYEMRMYGICSRSIEGDFPSESSVGVTSDAASSDHMHHTSEGLCN